MIETQKPQESARSDKKWWKKDAADKSKTCEAEPREGNPCPSCLLGELHYNGLFQLICDNCGRIAEAAVFT